MTMPRQVLPGSTYLITRTTRSRRFFIAPDGMINAIFWFCLASAAALTGVQLHAVAVLSNHVHLVLTDVRGELPNFMQWLFRHTSLCTKSLRKIEENMWSSDKPNVVKLVTAEAIQEAMAYVMSNPTSAGLIERSRKWPGVISVPEDLWGREQEFEMPKQYFRRPREGAALSFTVPSVLLERYGTVGAVVEQLKARVAEQEQEAAARLREQGRTFLGLEGIRRTSCYAQPKEPREGVEYGYRQPRIKAVVKDALKAALKELCEFWESYFEKLKRFRAGERPTFPPGTWWVVQYAGCPCGEASDG